MKPQPRQLSLRALYTSRTSSMQLDPKLLAPTRDDLPILTTSLVDRISQWVAFHSTDEVDPSELAEIFEARMAVVRAVLRRIATSLDAEYFDLRPLCQVDDLGGRVAVTVIFNGRTKTKAAFRLRTMLEIGGAMGPLFLLYDDRLSGYPRWWHSEPLHVADALVAAAQPPIHPAT